MLAAASEIVLSRVKPQILDSLDSSLFAIVVMLLLILVVVETRNALNVYNRSRGSRGEKKLPGPRGIPVLGNVHQLGASPHKTFVEMAKTYGDVFRIHIGNRMVVVLNGYDTIRQALVKQAVDFAGRPDITSFKYINTYRGYPTISFSTHSDSWKLHRKITESTFRHFTSGKKMSCVDEKVREEATELIGVLTDNNNKDGNVVDPQQIVRASVANILFSFIFSARRSLNDEHLNKFLSMMDKFDDATSTGNPVDFMPWLRFFPNKTMKRFKEILNDFVDLLKPHEEDVKAQYEEGSDRNILEHFITVSRTIGQEEKMKLGITEEQIAGTVFDLFGAGVSTVSTTISWCILYSMRYPQWQERIQQELDEVVGRDRLPSISDRGHLPILEAFIIEVMRHTSVIPMTLPHSTTRDTSLNGYFIPKDTVVFVNLHSVAHDNTRFEDPQKFNPSRFLNEDGTALDPAKTDLVMPFGAGRRRCLGSELGRAETFLYSAHLLHQCTFALPEGQSFDFTPKTGIALNPKPYQAKVTQRL